MSVGAYVLLVNRTFIWPVTFPCSRIVYNRKNLFVRETPVESFLPHIMLIYCVISCASCCFPGLMTFCLLHTVYTSYSNFLCNFLSSCMCVCAVSSPMYPDIGSWLQLFGFQLHNVVPGFPKPEVGITEQTYELMKTQTKTQDWDSSKVSCPSLQSPIQQGSLIFFFNPLM